MGKTVRLMAQQSGLLFFLIVAIAAFPSFLQGLDAELYFFGSPYIVSSVHATAVFIGLTATSYTLGILFFSYAGGFLFDVFSAKYTLVLAVSIFSIFVFLTGYVTSIYELLIFRLIVGFGIGMFQPAMLSFLGDILVKFRGRSIIAFEVFFGFGYFVAPYLIEPFLPDYKIPFMITGLISLISIVLFIAVVPPVYSKIEKRKLGLRAVANRNIVILSVAVFLFGIALLGLLSYLSDFLLHVLHYSVFDTALAASMMGLAGVIFAYPLGYGSDKARSGRKAFIIMTLGASTVGSLGIFFLGDLVGLIAMIGFVFIFGIGRGLSVIFITAAAQDSVGDSLVGRISGVIYTMFNIGAIMGGPLMGTLSTAYGFKIGGLVAVTIPLLVATVFSIFLVGAKPSAVSESTVASPN
jgi:MFS family permease